ncbi:MAG: hypothetical protein WC319_10690 [Candidatus Paceibacterota bacterium]|jgi:hypothetical protein
MTLSELLADLKMVDYKTWNDIDLSLSFLINVNSPSGHALIQSCIQRACESRGWTWSVYKQTPEEEKSYYAEICEIGPGYDGDYYNQYHESCITWKEANSPAEALLGAYITAIKMKQSASKKQYKKCGDFYMDTTIDSSKTKGNKINELIY